jgi:O-acetyl-ADP-ribose deacetylase (regulator of RNase III)
MELTIKQMDLFKCKRKVLVHCISQDCAMGAGIAKTFNRKFPEMKSKLKKYLKENHISYPTALTYIMATNDTMVINMITKSRYFHKPTYSDFKTSLEKVKNICLESGYDEIAMPKIGCGLDGLSWSKVQDIIKEVFKDTDIDILVCIL